MKKIILNVLVAFYGINNTVLRYALRKIIAELDGGQAFSENLRIIMKKYHGIDIGIGTYGACFRPDQMWCGFNNLKIGKFSSFAKGVCIYTRNHPYWKPSTSPLFYNAKFVRGGVEQDTVEYGNLEIGNDVWIGQYVVILPSCKKIGDGAVIGAGSMITKNVPDYAVVVGNPGKIIKYRFEPEVIELLKEVRWWDWEKEKILNNLDFFQDIEGFCQKFAR